MLAFMSADRRRWAQEWARACVLDLCASKVSGKVITRAEGHGAKVYAIESGLKVPMGYGVIGNTTVSGTVILGSSPGIPALNNPHIFAVIRSFKTVRRFETIVNV
jgi:hypothetical protein